MLGINNDNCIICNYPSNVYMQEDETGKSYFAGRQVKLDCNCKSYYHASCILTHLNTEIAVPAPDSFSESTRRDIARGGSTVDMLLLSDAKSNARKSDNCPTCREKPINYTVFNGSLDTPQETKPVHLLSEEISEEKAAESERIFQMNQRMTSAGGLNFLNKKVTYMEGKMYVSKSKK